MVAFEAVGTVGTLGTAGTVGTVGTVGATAATVGTAAETLATQGSYCFIAYSTFKRSAERFEVLRVLQIFPYSSALVPYWQHGNA